MCVIIDVNRYHELFLTSQYEYTLSTLYDSNGPKICYGGEKYLLELGEKRIKSIEEFSKLNKILRLNDQQVDLMQNRLEKQLIHTDFDDPHIMAMCKLTGCRLIITNDVRMKTPIDFFFTNKKKPKLIKSDKNSNLLYNSNYRI